MVLVQALPWHGRAAGEGPWYLGRAVVQSFAFQQILGDKVANQSRQ